MTREQTISNLKKLKSFHNGSYGSDIDRAIKALEQELCEDCVSRADAIKTAIEAADDWDGGYNLTRADIIEKAIESLPPVQPKYNTSEWCHDCSEYNQVKHCCPRFNNVIRKTVEEIKQPKVAHWKEIGYHIYECSECGRVESINDFENVYIEYPYCHCGCRMVKPQKSEDKEC